MIDAPFGRFPAVDRGPPGLARGGALDTVGKRRAGSVAAFSRRDQVDRRPGCLAPPTSSGLDPTGPSNQRCYGQCYGVTPDSAPPSAFGEVGTAVNVSAASV